MWLHSNLIFYKSDYGKSFNEQLKVLHGFSKGIIKERKESRKNRQQKPESDNEDNVGVKNRKAFLDLLLDVCEQDEGNSLTDEDIRAEVDTFMFEVKPVR